MTYLKFGQLATGVLGALYMNANTVAASGGATFHYEEFGDNWGQDFPMCRDGRMQSPIDLPGRNLVVSKDMKLMGYDYKNYPEKIMTRMEHTIVTDLTDGELMITFWDGNTVPFVPL